MFSYFQIDPKLKILADEAQLLVSPYFAEVKKIQEYNQQKMLAAFIDVGVSESHFAASTGYGYGDRGKDALDRVYAKAFDCEDALVRHNFVSGTHALTVALFGVLRPDDRILCVTGTPYDTIQHVFGLAGESSGSLKEFGIHYEQVDLLQDGAPDFATIEERLRQSDKSYKAVYIQRSRGYSLRPSLNVKTIGDITELVHKVDEDCIVMVDNCYGEFVEKDEPTSRGADMIVGSLIKNPGGGIAPTGGYIAGRRDLIEACSFRLTTPGTGKEVGSTLGHNRELFMGAFAAPHVVGEAIMTAIFGAALFTKLGFDVTPNFDEVRTDIIQAILLREAPALIAFCTGVQKGAPIDSFVTPEPSDMPGYDSQVIMAAGAFILGASIEFSADAPLREPYAVWMQGGLQYHSAKMGVMLAAQEMLSNGIISI